MLLARKKSLLFLTAAADAVNALPVATRSDAVIARLPSVRVLFTSGYTEDAIFHHGRLDPDVTLLPKPYRKSDLARMIRQVLAQPPASAVAAK